MYLLPGSALLTTIWGLSPFYSKYLNSLGHSPEFILFISSVLFFVLMTIVMLFMHSPANLLKELNQFYNKINPIYFLFWVFFIYILAMIVYYRLLANHHTFLVIALTSIYPLVTLLAAYFIFKEKPKPIHFLAVLLITIGIVLIQL